MAIVVATVAMMARPRAPPTWRVVLIRPEASPASWGGTPAVADRVIGTNDIPSPKPISTTGPSTCDEVGVTGPDRGEPEEAAGGEARSEHQLAPGADDLHQAGADQGPASVHSPAGKKARPVRKAE